MKNDVIQLLPDSVANQIAAGEVIQRPASVIKELVENSIDAGAGKIQIVIKDAGKTLIQIIDDGCGMSETDARMAFERHATSKIRKADDLFTLHTMGFRGEALPSIAAVSEVDMRTMQPGEQLGTHLVIKGCKVESQEPDVCAVGTNISVKHLFFNIVARRRFLKKDSVEFSHIMHEFERMALVNTQVDISITHNGTMLHNLHKSSLSQRIGELFGHNMEKQLIPVNTQTTMVTISGFVGLPASARVRNPLQYFFVNGRNMRHGGLRKAIMNCYQNLIAPNAQPNYFINFQVDPSRIDVNIHPQKHEIKFEDEQLIYQVLTAAVNESLGKYNVAGAIDFDATDVPDIPPINVGEKKETSPVDDPLDPDYSPFEMASFPDEAKQNQLFGHSSQAEATSFSTARRERSSALNNANWEALYRGFANESLPSVEATTNNQLPELPQMDADDEDVLENSWLRIRNRWIVTPGKSGMMIIDLRRAHILVLYHRFLPSVTMGQLTSQHLIFAEEIEVDAATENNISSAKELLCSLGFELQFPQPGLCVIEGMPTQLSAMNPRAALLNIVNDLVEIGLDPHEEQRRRIALSMAKAAAVSGTKPLEDAEINRIVSDLFKLSAPNYTPDGQRVIQVLTIEQIASYFHR